jgi:PAS domain S-box-containing protein
MRDSLSFRFSAVLLALLTLAAVVFGLLNFQQRSRFSTPDDGVSWFDSPVGAEARYVSPNSPGERAGIHIGDIVVALDGVTIHTATQVTRRLWQTGIWIEARYSIRRAGETIDVRLITAPAEKPASIENFLRIVGLLYLFIGIFIFIRRWNALRTLHFYIFCLVSFVLYFFHYSGKLNGFDWIIYWANEVALLLQPALLVHFALVFPEKRRNLRWWLAGVYAVPAALLLLHISVATQTLDLLPSIGNRHILDQRELAYLGVYFLAAALIFLGSFLRAPSGALRQQLKWVTGGTFAGILPFLCFYILPYSLGATPSQWMEASTLSLCLIPLCFGYAIIRYRLMDVDIIFKRGLAHTFATGAVVGIYFAVLAVVGNISKSALPRGPGAAIVAIVVAGFLFQPLRDWVQARLDRFFYRERLDYRQTLMEFGKALTHKVHLDPLLSSVLERISNTLLVDRAAIFLEAGESGGWALTQSLGLPEECSLDLSFLDRTRGQLDGGCLFFESGRGAHESESVRSTLDQLGLHYFVPCRFHDRTVAVLGLGKTRDGEYLSSDDVELVSAIAGYVAVGIENARLYHSLEEKAGEVERLKDFSENIVASLSVGVLTAGLDDKIESWNPQIGEMLERPAADAIGRSLTDVLPPELSADIASQGLESPVTGVYRYRLALPSKRALVANVSVAPLQGKSGERIGRLILIDDITQRARMEDQMLQTEKLTSLGLLAAGVAHEVNTPLAVISNYIQMLAKQIPAEDSKQLTIDKIVRQTFRASEIVNNLLNFSRTGGAEFREVDLNALLDETLLLVQHPMKTAKVTTLRNYGVGLPPVVGSPNRLQQVFLNFFLNARDAMPNGGMLEVRTAAPNGSVEVEITDTGMGIPAENLHRIFDPFFTTKSSGRGTGLGLSVSYGIIKEHAGKIDVRSTPGKGTSFRLEFPAARKEVHA